MISDKYLIKKDSDIDEVSRVLMDGKISGTSDVVKLYECLLANYFGVSKAVAVSSGTAAIHCALYAAGVNEGDEVIMPCTAPMMTALPILLMKAKIVFCDTNGVNFGMDISDLSRCITKRTKVVIDVPMWGYPTNAAEIARYCRECGVVFIQDSAQAHGTIDGGRFSGTIGDIGCFSTHDRKLLSTGEGGFILTNDVAIAQKIKRFINFGGMTGDSIGTNYKLSSVQAALGISRITSIAEQVRDRTENAKYLLKSFDKSIFTEVHYTQDSAPNYYSLALLYRGSQTTGREIAQDMNSLGIPSDVYRYNYRPLYEYKLFAPYARVCRQSEELIKKLITLSVHPGLARTELETIRNYIGKIE